ncbi:hypothetical protein HN873_049895, partial [Arachis hypogaea]
GSGTSDRACRYRAEVPPGQLVDVVGAMLQIAEAESLEEGTRHLAIEFVITLAEARERAPGMMRKLPQFISRMFAILMKMLLDIEDDPAWHSVETEDEDAGETRTLVPLLKFYFHEEVRKAAISVSSPALVDALHKVLCAGKDLATEQTAGRMINLLRQLQQTLPPATLASTCLSFLDSVTSEFHCIRAQASGSTKIEGIPEKTDSKDDNLVFVAGATGRVGSRTIRELIKLGFKVRARVRSAERAGLLIKSVEQMKLDDGTSGGSQAVEKLEIVECDLEKPDQIGPALGNASTVICSIGASEKEVFDITGPCRIDYRATKSLIDAATVAKIVRPRGMERPTDSYKETYNLTLSTEDTLFGGQVSNLQVAELMAVMAKNPDLAYCKIVEVVEETTAPLNPTEELLAKISSQRPYISSPKVCPFLHYKL